MAELPTGTVTFLFTDIEGSTTHWERQPHAMRAALAHHDALLRQIIAAHAGTVFKTVGDAVCAVFPTAPQALDAALAAQRAIRDTDWTAFGIDPLTVRMAIHTGVAELRDGDYFGRPLNCVARLLATGHGGQILLSLAAEQLVRDELPPDTYLRDLGTGGLRGLVHAEHIYQLVAPDLPSDFPPLKALDAQYVEPLRGDGARQQNPYKGLRAFHEADAPDFFGRETLTERLLARLGEPVPFNRFLAVVGPSGSGKSSVVRAGLVPALRQGVMLGSEHWLITELLPGAHPLEELEAVLLHSAGNPPETLINQLREDERGLVRAAKRVLPRDETTALVLIIDQFEEVFTLVADEPERVHFLTSLHAAVSDSRSRVWVIITLRADFYDRPLLYPDPGELLRQRTEVVLPLSAEELERAIVRPAARVGVELEPELVATIIREVGEQPGVLPLLQHALTELFERRQGRRLTLAAYRASGGVLGALPRRAEEIYAGLGATEQAAARQLFLRLITLGEGVEDTRRRVKRLELAALAGDPRVMERVVEAFGQYRLLTFSQDAVTYEPTVEVAHEALLRTWERLREWLETSRANLRLERQLLLAAGEWVAAGHDTSFLATGTRLAQFEALAAQGDIVLTGEERAYLEASIAERQRREATERERLQH
ncbi:MAG TPA: adenylate/guanylate cyclase domain-containing protein, partial [Herpetosiphonaceae bacterium]|nr:adenylate/guanylate cyclase domain-containing protein [Herpetosiphonaceae bacterium]